MPQPTDRSNFITFPAIAAATISTSLGSRNSDHRSRPYRSPRRRRTTPVRGIDTYSDEVISSLGSAYISSPPVLRDKEINHLFGCTSPLQFRTGVARDEAPLPLKRAMSVRNNSDL